jgi:hypothetical protein
VQLVTDESAAGPGKVPEQLRLVMTPEELVLVNNAIAAVRDEIDREEFRTRLGAEPEEADRLRTALATIEHGADGARSTRSSDRRSSRGRAEEIVVGMTEDQLLLVNNALNEVLNGLAIADFETRLGADRRQAAALLAAVGAVLDQRAPEAASLGTSGSDYFDRLR